MDRTGFFTATVAARKQLQNADGVGIVEFYPNVNNVEICTLPNGISESSYWKIVIKGSLIPVLQRGDPLHRGA